MAQSATAPIGVLDSGVGGLTVVRELRRLLPGEEIVYFGDNANCPYGNNTAEQMLAIARNMLDFLRDKGVKMVVLACNTISSMVELLEGEYGFPLVSIIAPAAKSLAESGAAAVGVIATRLTVESHCYRDQIQAHNPALPVVEQASLELARLVDCGAFDYRAIDADVAEHVNALLAARPDISHIVMGCTHYPIVSDAFARAAPGLELVDPAIEQVRRARDLLAARGLLNPAAQGALRIHTSGGPAVYPVYRAVTERLRIGGAYSIEGTR